jgi:hypothetical protein
MNLPSLLSIFRLGRKNTKKPSQVVAIMGKMADNTQRV